MWYYTNVKAWVTSKEVSYSDGMYTFTYQDGPRFVEYGYSGPNPVDFTILSPVAYYAINIRNQKNYDKSITSSTGGTCGISGGSAEGSYVTLTPTAYEGYKFTGYTVLSGSANISGNGFYLYSDVSIRANFVLNDFNLTGKSEPAEGGTVIFTNGSTAISKQTVNKKVYVSHSDTPGWSFQGYTTVPANLSIDENGIFTMPMQHVTITANYKKISVPALGEKNLTGGGTVALTIAADKATYTHKYQLSFGTGMATPMIDVAAGVTQVTIAVPLNWCAQIPNQTSKAGGTLTLYTYDGASLIGSSQVTGLTFIVPVNILPTLTALQIERALTVEGTTYNAIDDLYVQNHCGVRIRTTAAGAQSSTIASIVLTLSGYDGNKYNKTQTSGNSLDFTSGLLTAARETRITVTATDSRGRTVTLTGTIDVKAYTMPTGTLELKRADQYGVEDEMGIYGIYELSKRYTQLGSNSLTWILAYSGGSSLEPGDSGMLLPGDTKTFIETQEYSFTLTLIDALETNVITAVLPSARYILAFDQSGDKIGVMKFPNKSIPAGKAGTFEFSQDLQIYIGNDKLEDYIRNIVQNM